MIRRVGLVMLARFRVEGFGFKGQGWGIRFRDYASWIRDRGLGCGLGLR